MTKQDAIAKAPTFDQSEDFYFLRQKGFEYIEQLGSHWWTDYNAHDPGITILEALCYAITDLGYRIGWDVKDLLASIGPKPANDNDQAFFTPRNILTTNPLTTNDYRRLLVDLPPIRNAWVLCRQCACEIGLFGNCRESKLAYHHPAGQDNVIKITPQGTYDVLLELENDPKLGDLNNRKLRHQFNVKFGNPGNEKRYPIVAEIRFPDLDASVWGDVFEYTTTVEGEKEVKPKGVKAVFMQRLSLNTEGKDATEDELRDWRNVFYTTLRVKLDDGTFIYIKNATVRMFGKSAVQAVFLKKWLEEQLEDSSTTVGIVPLFFEKMTKVQKAILLVKDHLHAHRNLAEDFCCVDRVCVEDVAVCADIEVRPDADIDKVQSQVLYEIENYFNPGIKFYSLPEMMDAKVPVEQIFEGPQMKHGFLKTDELEAAQLKKKLRTSDIINLLVEIEGVVAVKGLMLTRYDELGRAVRGVADVEKGNPNQLSAHWTLEISNRCQPRLYVENSKFLFIKNGLPFIARQEEVHHTLQQLRGESERLKIKNDPDEDLRAPQGRYRDTESYFPVQYSFPLTYGIGHEGLPETASTERKAKARQLKAYLLFFEQLLGNQFAQVANLRQLFSIDPSISKTYFTKNLRNDSLIRDVTNLIDIELDNLRLKEFQESEQEFLDRRNRFLDHLLARFSEDFSDYTLTKITLAEDRLEAQYDLIKTKAKFLEKYDSDSRNRARAEDYKSPLAADNYAALRRRIARLLGLDDMAEQQVFIIEHLLLRPRFPGDALMPVCLDLDCNICHDAGPYSFQMTVVMPGWERLTDDDLHWRRYAERTIQMQAPAHVLVKICWVGDERFEFDPCAVGLRPVVDIFCQKGITAAGIKPDNDELELVLKAVWEAFKLKFEEWIAGREMAFFELESSKRELKLFFKNNDPFGSIADPILTNLDALKDGILNEMANYFAVIAVEGLQYTRLRNAWETWRASTAKIDWCEKMPLRECLESLLLSSEQGKVFEKENGRALKPAEVQAVKNCACEIIERFGQAFHEQVTQKLDTQEDQPVWDLPPLVGSICEAIFDNGHFRCDGMRKLRVDDRTKIKALFKKMYTKELVEASRNLKRLIGIFTNLKSIYPPATLHDCDDGSDENPVRLGSTALGGGF